MSRTRPRSKRTSGPFYDSTPRLLFQKELKSSTPRSKTTRYDPFLPSNDKFVVHGDSVERNLWTRDRAPFRFLELPQELQDAVLTYHYQPVSELCLEGSCSLCDDTKASSAKHDCSDHYQTRINGTLPSLAIELACSKTMRGSRAARDKIWPKTLMIEEKVQVESLMKDFANGRKWKWLRDRTNSIVFKEVSSFALSQEISWNIFAVTCPSIKHYTIHHRHRKGYVNWAADDYEANADAEEPDYLNLLNLKPATLLKLLLALEHLHDGDYTVKVESAVWWSLMHTARQSYFEKTLTYDLTGEPFDIEAMKKKYEVKELEDLRVAETRLQDDWSP